MVAFSRESTPFLSAVISTSISRAPNLLESLFWISVTKRLENVVTRRLWLSSMVGCWWNSSWKSWSRISVLFNAAIGRIRVTIMRKPSVRFAYFFRLELGNKNSVTVEIRRRPVSERVQFLMKSNNSTSSSDYHGNIDKKHY